MTKTTNNKQPPPEIGAPIGGGFLAGCLHVDGQLFALVVAPKDEGEHDNTEWNGSYDKVSGAMTYDDGLANTKAMADADSALAKWAMALRIGGHDDWYLPSQDELEIIYRNLKPTTKKNWCYARSGINLSAVEPMRPYAPDLPTQTSVNTFKAGGDQSFEGGWYWSSTQHVSHSDYAWCQDFGHGNQINTHKLHELRARAVRRLPI